MKFQKQELKEKFRILQSQYLVCKFNKCLRYTNNYMENNFIQVVLEVICDKWKIIREAEFMQDIFDSHSNEDFYYVKSDFFKDFIERDLNINFDEISMDEKEKILNKYLSDNKIIILRPYYFYNENRDVFFKNGTVADVFQATTKIPDSYCTIPVIRNENVYEAMSKKENFPLSGVREDFYDEPDYLFYQGENTVLKVTLESVEDNDCFWHVTDNEYTEIQIDYEKMKLDNTLIECENGNFVFVAEDYILNNKNGIKKSFKNRIIEEDTSSKNDSYSYSEKDKDLLSFYEYTKNSRLSYTKEDIYNFYTCICSSQLLILAGMSGTGKTKLPLKFAEYFNMSENNGNLLFLPISPSYTEPSDVLGYLNPNTGIYCSSETRLVEFLKHAEDNKDKMHMVIFDEMNLSQIEFWFAPFISILEKEIQDRYIHLYSENQRCINSEKYPYKIKINNNIIFIGTINLDETTKSLSDRLLDRSYVINLKKKSFVSYYSEQSNLPNDIVQLERSKKDFKELMPNENVIQSGYITKFSVKELEFFDRIHSEFNKIDSQMGISFRSVKNIAIYLMNKPDDFEKEKAFDYAFKQTILKKLNGSIESIGSLVGINENGYVDESRGILQNILNEYVEISDFKESKIEINNKIKELVKYGYAR